MPRPILSSLVLMSVSVAVWPSRAADPPPTGSSAPPLSYELMINGETFVLEANRLVTLQSQQKPGVSYRVAIQIAMQQQVALDNIRFDYDWPATVTEDRRRAHRMVRIRHELGFSMILTDLGEPLDAAAQDEALKLLSDSIVESFRASGMKKLTVSEPYEQKFAKASARGVSIRYEDSQGVAQTSLACVLTGPRFSASCVAQYFDSDAERAVPQVKKILESIRPAKAPDR